MVKSTKQILILAPRPDAPSGVSTHLNQLKSALPADFNIHHFQVGSEGRSETKAGKIARLIISPALLALVILKKSPDIVHINASLDKKSFPRDSIYLAVARLLRRQVVFQVHGGEFPNELYPQRPALTRLVARVLRTATAVVLLSRSEVKRYAEFEPRANLAHIPNAVRLNPHAPLHDDESDGPLRLVYIGRLVETKGVADSVEAAKLLRDCGRDFRFVIAGTGPVEQALREQVRELGLDAFVTFSGPVFGEHKDRLWWDSDVFVFPTFHREGLPYALLESMAAGTVPITTGVGANPDVLENGRYGVLVPEKSPSALCNAIAKLDDDRTLLASLAQSASSRIRERYTVDRLGSEFAHLYRSLS